MRVGQLLKTVPFREIIEAFDAYAPGRAGRLTEEWLQAFASLPKTSNAKEYEIFVADPHDAASPEPWLRLGARPFGVVVSEEEQTEVDFAYKPWSSVVSYHLNKSDLARYGPVFLLVVIIDDLTYHGWHEANRHRFLLQLKRKHKGLRDPMGLDLQRRFAVSRLARLLVLVLVFLFLPWLLSEQLLVLHRQN